MTQPLVDVTIAVHSAARPIARAVASVVEHTSTPVRVTVVAHNIDPALIHANLGEYARDPRVRLMELSDGIRSPAGPMNHGLAASDAPFVAVLGSDDEFAPGAIDSWLRLQQETGASTVLARIVLGARGADPYPPVRDGRRTRRLDARKDRLSYRSAPLGLIDRTRFGDLRFTEGLPSGEDLAYSATLWFTGRNLAYDLTGPGYIVHADAEDRVTFAPRPVADDFAFVAAIERTPWFPRLGRRDRVALAVKILRVHFFDAVLARVRSDEGIAGHRAALIAVLNRIESLAPGAVALLARADRAVIDELNAPDPDPDRILHLLDARWNYRSVASLLTRNPILALHRQGPLRTLRAGMRATTAT